MFAQIFVVVAILASVGIASAQTVFAPPRIAGIGADRRNITSANLENRTLGIIRAREFWIFRQECAKDAPRLIFEHWKTIQNAAAWVKGKELDPYLLAAHLFIESCGRTDVQSPTGPRGIAQFTEASALEQNKFLGKPVPSEFVMVIQKIQKFRDVPRRNRRGQILTDRNGRALTRRVPYWEYVRDDRLDPVKSIHAMARRLLQRYEWYGAMDFAVAEYHMGAGRMNQLLSAYTGLNVVVNPTKRGQVAAKEVIAKRQLRYAKIFFDNLPHYKRTTLQHIQRLERVDFSPTYFFRVQMAAGLLRFYRGEGGGSPALYEERRKKYEGARGLMWSFFTPDEQKRLMIEDLEALLEAREMGRLVPLPRNEQFFGVRPRLIGRSPIGQADLKNQEQYVASEASTIGALLYVTSELRQMDPTHCRIIETNSLVRTLDTQGGLRRGGNRNAATELPTHVMAKAFDIPYLTLGRDCEENLEFLLDDLEDYGMIAYRKERNQRTFHVVPHPEFEQFFDKVYAEAERQLAARNPPQGRGQRGRVNIAQ